MRRCSVKGSASLLSVPVFFAMESMGSRDAAQEASLQASEPVQAPAPAPAPAPAQANIPVQHAMSRADALAIAHAESIGTNADAHAHASKASVVPFACALACCCGWPCLALQATVPKNACAGCATDRNRASRGDRLRGFRQPQARPGVGKANGHERERASRLQSVHGRGRTSDDTDDKSDERSENDFEASVRVADGVHFSFNYCVWCAYIGPLQQ